MEQKPQSNKLARHPYVIDPKERIAHLQSLLDSSKPCYAKQGANINAAIALWENGYDGSKKIHLIDGKQIGSLEEALLHEGPVWIEVGAMFGCVF